MPSTDELAAMRAAQLELMPDTAAVRRRQLTRTPSGGASEAWVAVAGLGAVPARVGQPTRAEREMVAGRLSRPMAYVVTAPWDAAMLEGDRVTVGGLELELLGCLNEGASWRTAARHAAAKVAP